MQKLTQKLIETVAAPSQKCLILRDTTLKGFGLRITTGGHKSFVVEARVHGKSRRITIGRADVMPVDEARDRATKLLLQMTSGVDPQEEKAKQELANISLGEVLDHFLTVRRLRESYRKAMHKVITRHLVDLAQQSHFEHHGGNDSFSALFARCDSAVTWQRHDQISRHADQFCDKHARAGHQKSSIDHVQAAGMVQASKSGISHFGPSTPSLVSNGYAA